MASHRHTATLLLRLFPWFTFRSCSSLDSVSLLCVLAARRQSCPGGGWPKRRQGFPCGGARGQGRDHPSPHGVLPTCSLSHYIRYSSKVRFVSIPRAHLARCTRWGKHTRVRSSLSRHACFSAAESARRLNVCTSVVDVELISVWTTFRLVRLLVTVKNP